MATPNIVNVATINAKNAAAKLTGTSRTEAIDVPADKVAKVNTILVANVDGTNAADISVSIYDGSTDRYIAKVISVPAKATQILCAKDTYFYLEEGDSIRAVASVASDLELVIGYEDIS